MKGIDPALRILVLIAVGVVGLMIAMFIITAFTTQPTKDVDTTGISMGSGFFNHNPYLLDLTKTIEKPDPFVKNDIFCDKLKKCIIQSWQTGVPCQVDTIIAGDSTTLDNKLPNLGGLDDEELIRFGYSCDDEILYNEPILGVKAKVCEYKEIENRQLRRHGSQAGLSYDNCKLYDGSDDVLFNEDDVTIEDDWYDSATALKPNIHFNVDQLYTDRMSIIDTETDYRYNGAGRYRFMVDGVFADEDGNCSYNLLVCARPSIALTADESIIEIFDIVRMMPTGQFETLPFYVSDLSDNADKISSLDDVNLYYFSEYVVDLGDSTYTTTQMFNAVKGGFEAKGSEMNWAAPYWTFYDVSSSVHPYYISSYLTPWNNNLNSLLESSDENNRMRSLYINCGQDKVCEDEVKVKMAFRRDIEEQSGKDLIWHSIVIAIMSKS
ncbi:MAG: hypothetical protein GOV02_01010 [Candidatus Aenigmarchaeota archaeon]|nr:hypothetical protein [Candidatus Aenigmarchaeota archaeon]